MCVVSGEGALWLRQAWENVVCVVGRSAMMSYCSNSGAFCVV